MGSRLLPGGASEVGGDDVGRVPVQAAAGTVVADRGARVSVGGGFLNIAQGDARVETAVMNACRSVCGPTGLLIPARAAARRTIRAAPCRSSRRPSAARKIGPSQ